MSDYKPDYDEHGVGFCSHELCPQYDGKRCRLTGFQPHGVCEPWGIDAARDKRAMDIVRSKRNDVELDTVEDTEGTLFWLVSIGWGEEESSDLVTAIIKAAEKDAEHQKMLDKP